MTHQVIEDYTQMMAGDILEYRCPRYGIVTQWEVDGIHLGALRVQSIVTLKPITKTPTDDCSVLVVPEEMTRAMTIIRRE